METESTSSNKTARKTEKKNDGCDLEEEIEVISDDEEGKNREEVSSRSSKKRKENASRVDTRISEKGKYRNENG